LFHPSPFARGLNLACYAAICCVSFSLTAHAQQPSLPPLPPAKSASEPSAMERSRRQSENVYKFIKQFADTPRKPDAAPARPKVEAVAAPAPVRRPETPSTATPAAVQSQPDAAPAAAAAGSTNIAPAQASTAPTPVAPPEPAAAPAAAAVAAVEEEEDDELQLIAQVDPVYPRGMQGAPDSGRVTVALTVQPDGTVSEASVVTASHRRFGKPAADAVAQWRFAPIKTARTVRVEIGFNPR
jgi:TonB family protein